MILLCWLVIFQSTSSHSGQRLWATTCAIKWVFLPFLWFHICFFGRGHIFSLYRFLCQISSAEKLISSRPQMLPFSKVPKGRMSLVDKDLQRVRLPPASTQPQQRRDFLGHPKTAHQIIHGDSFLCYRGSQNLSFQPRSGPVEVATCQIQLSMLTGIGCLGNCSPKAIKIWTQMPTHRVVNIVLR